MLCVLLTSIPFGSCNPWMKLVLQVQVKCSNSCRVNTDWDVRISSYRGGGALDPKLGKHVRRAKKITGPLLVQTSREILRKLTLISANFS